MTPHRKMIINAIRHRDDHTIPEIAACVGASQIVVREMIAHMIEDGTLDKSEVIL